MRAQHYYNSAKKLYETGNYPEALKECDNALTFDPLFYDAIYLRGTILYRAGTYKDATEWLKKVCQIQPDNTQLRLLVTDAAMKAGKYGVAVNQLKILLEKEPGNQELLFLLRYAQIKSRNDTEVGKAIKEIERLIGQDHDDPRIYCLAAELAILRNDLTEAEMLLAKHYTPHMIWSETMLMLADSYIAANNFHKVIELYKSLIEKTDEKKPLQTRLSDILLNNKKFTIAEPVLRDMTGQYPDDTDLQIKLFTCLKALKQYDDAERIISDTISKQPDNFDFIKKKIELFIQKTDYAKATAEAAHLLKKIDKTSPQHLDIKNLMADIYFYSGNYSAAAKCAEEVLMLNPNNTHARFNLCRIKMQTSASIEVIGELRQIINENPRDSELYYYLGLAHSKRNELVMAEKAFLESMKIDPANKEALIALGELYFQQGAFSSLEPIVREYEKINPDDNETRQILAAIKRKYMSQ